MKRTLPLAVPLLLLAFPALAGACHARTHRAEAGAELNTIWVVLAALLVFFMQAGFAFLEIGFSRAKNAGTVVAKILTNLSIASLGYWACGFAFAFGAGEITGTTASSCPTTATRRRPSRVMGFS